MSLIISLSNRTRFPQASTAGLDHSKSGHTTNLYAWAWLLLLLPVSGCMGQVTRITWTCDAIPANRLPPEILAPHRSGKVPIDFTLLRQQPPKSYIISAGDTLGVYIQGIVPSSTSTNEQAPLYTNTSGTRDPYPATGLIHAPIVGLPLIVDMQGSLDLPFVDRIPLQGLNLGQASEAIRKSYVVDHKILQPGRDRIVVTLIKPRVHRVLVIREDVNSSLAPSFYNPVSPVYTKRGSAEVIDLPAYENDVLHAVMASGGLPGIDVHNAVWVLRSRVQDAQDVQPALQQMRNGGNPRDLLQAAKTSRSYLYIPLRTNPDQVLPFTEKDIILHDGDIVYLQSRDDEVFYTGGLLPGTQLPLPRDRDLDIIAAMAMANAAVGGPPGQNGADANFRSYGPGGVVNPTRAIVIRKLPNGEELKIRVDLNRAVVDSRERIIIQPEDFVMLQLTPTEFTLNFLLSFGRTNITYIPK